jgi:hypothetical protein
VDELEAMGVRLVMVSIGVPEKGEIQFMQILLFKFEGMYADHYRCFDCRQGAY